MGKHFRRDSSSVPPQAETDLVGLIKKVQQQLTFLEKKIDTLIGQSQERPFKGKHFPKPFPKPFRPFGHAHHHDRGEWDNSPRERERDSSRGRHFEKHERREDQEFGPRKKPFFHRKKGRR